MYTNLQENLTSTLSQIEADGLWKSERALTTAQSAHVETAPTGDSDVLNFCANNYLGLADDARLIAAAKQGLDDYGYGCASVRFICGTQSIHKQLEARISQFLGTEDTILYSAR